MSEVVDRWAPEFAKTHLGASQVPAALGLSPYQRPVQLWEQYLDLAPRTEENEAIELGHALEAGVAEVAARRLGVTARASPTIIHPRARWLCATPDRVLSDGTLLQVKTSGLAGYQPKEVQDRWGEAGTDEVPIHVAAQVMTELAVVRAGLEGNGLSVTVHVAALLAGRGVVMYRVEWDEAVAARVLRGAQAFWECIERRTPPPVDGSDAYTEMLRRRWPTPRPDVWLEGQHVETLMEQYHAADKAYDEADERLKVARNQLCAEIGDAEGMMGSLGKIHWASRRNASRLQPSFFDEVASVIGRERLEQLQAQHTTSSGYHRALRAYWRREKA